MPQPRSAGVRCPDLRDLPDPARTSAPTALREPPASAGILERWVYDQAKRRDVPAARLRNAISYMALAGALDRDTDGGGRPRFMLKGAVTLELRLQGRSRMTEDLDVSVIRPGNLLELFDAALREPYRDFAFVRHGKVYTMPNGVRRVRVKLRYRTKPWATVPVDLSRVDHDDVEAERIPALDLSIYGLRGPADVACLSLRYQIAQKLHAVTAIPPDGHPNDASVMRGPSSVDRHRWDLGTCAQLAGADFLPATATVTGTARFSVRGGRHRDALHA